jgi:NAD(P)H-hydrate repair Nnr-like enzyme with NAD(P)H-hydrate dehydratase domain
VGAYQADLSGKPNAGKSYVIFGKQDNTDAINLSAIATGTSTGGFVINGESEFNPNTTYDLPADDLLFGSA